MYAIISQLILNEIDRIIRLIPSCSFKKCSQCEYRLICETAIDFQQKLKTEMIEKGVLKP